MNKQQKENFGATKEIINFSCYCNADVAFWAAVDHIELIIMAGVGNIRQKIKIAYEVYEMAQHQATLFSHFGVDVMNSSYDPSVYKKKLEDVYEKLSPEAKWKLTNMEIILCSNM